MWSYVAGADQSAHRSDEATFPMGSGISYLPEVTNLFGGHMLLFMKGDQNLNMLAVGDWQPTRTEQIFAHE